MAKRLIFTADYVYTPTAERRVSTKYRAGKRYLVNEECAIAAIAAGRARLEPGSQPGAPNSRPPTAAAGVVRRRRAKVVNA